MNEKNYKKRLDFQNKVIQRQSEQIDGLKAKIEELKLELEKKDETINSVSHLKNELSKNIAEIENKKNEYDKLIKELRKMKDIINKTVYKGRWNLIKILIR